MAFDKIKEIIIEQLSVEEDDITMDTHLMKDLEADSLDAVEIIMAIEDEFDIEGIGAIMRRHKQQFATLARQARLLYGDVLPLSAGTCTVCRRCTCPKRPCRFPKKRMTVISTLV